MNTKKNYMLFWLGGSLSQLGSAMTGFALILWAYMQSGSALAVSIMSFCNYVPYIIASLFAGSFIDRRHKKNIILMADTLAAICSGVVLLLWSCDQLIIWHIYIINLMISFMDAFQMPAQSIVLRLLVKEELWTRVSGLDSFTTNLVTMFAPFLASAIFAAGGLGLIIAIDLLTFVCNMILLLYVSVPEIIQKCNDKKQNDRHYVAIHFFRTHKGMWQIIRSLAVMNLFAHMTYLNILPAMLLARTQNSSYIAGLVNMFIGASGIIGGILVTLCKRKINSVKLIYVPAFISFLLGDILMGMGQNVIVWCIAAVCANLPIAFLSAGERVLLYKHIPTGIQGSVLAFRNAIQFSAIPAGILAGGFLADYVFEPFMNGSSIPASILSILIGTGRGSGMGLMFVCSGILGAFFCWRAYQKKEVQLLKETESRS